MKKYFIFLVLVTGFLFFSCSNQDSSVNPEQNNLTSRELIKLPARTGNSLEKPVSKLINGAEGGIIPLTGEYNNGEVKYEAALVIPKGAFQGEVTITMELDNEYAALIFSPHMVFDKPLTLDLKFEGVQVPDGDVEFAFIDDNGELDIIKSATAKDGKLSVTKAELEHFSRWIFIK